MSIATIPANLATITEGAHHGSRWVRVTSTNADGTVIVLYRGVFQIGSGTLSAGTVLIAVPPLATGDLIQASVTQLGNLCGLPVRVSASDSLPTGWKIPQTVEVVNPDGSTQTLTASAYQERFGELPAAVYDPTELISVVAPDPQILTLAPSSQILFDLRVEQSAGLTTVTIQNVVNQAGLPLVRWAPGESFVNSLSRTYTANATLTIDVRGENDTTHATKTVSLTVFNPPTSAPLASDIKALSYRLMGSSDFVRVCVNSLKACECRLEGFDMSWQAMIFYGYGPDYQEGSFYPVPTGTYTIWARVAGDTDATHWKSLTITTS